ncbi:MAG: hypothetical protein AAF226_19070 [Verrucomicrobiota bacterium]
MPIFFDISKYVKGGSYNSISVTTQSRHDRPSFILTGQLKLSNGQTVELRSNSRWKATFSPFEYTKQEWINSTVPVDHWANAKKIAPPETDFLRFVPHGVFEQPFEGRWLPVRTGAEKFKTQWEVSGESRDHWVRVVSTEPYILKINGETVRVNSGKKLHNGHGRWMVRTTGRRALSVPPQHLDPDEATEVFTGKGYLAPKHARPSELELIDPDVGFNLSQDTTQADEYGNLYKRSNEEFIERPSHADPLNEVISTRLPKSVTRQYVLPDYSGFEVSSFLKRGSNDIELTMFTEKEDSFFGARARKIAIDGAGFTREGVEWGLSTP